MPSRRLFTPSRFAALVGAALLIAAPLASSAPRQSGRDPFAFFASVFALTPSERAELGAGKAIVRPLDGTGMDIGVVSVVETRGSVEQFIAITRDLPLFKKSTIVKAMRGVSLPPDRQEFAGVPVPDADLDALRRCEPGDCGVKLSAREIADVRRAIDAAGRAWKPAAADALRGVLFERMRAYAAGGASALAEMNDRGDRHHPPARLFAELAAGHQYLRPQLSGALTLLERGEFTPPPPPATIEAQHLYWSAEDAGAKMTITGTHMVVVRPNQPGAPLAISLSRQLFATHYFAGTFNVLALVGDPGDGRRYIVAVNRAKVDVLEGFLGGVARSFIGRRLRSDAPGLIQDFKQRLESLPPPASRHTALGPPGLE